MVPVPSHIVVVVVVPLPLLLSFARAPGLCCAFPDFHLFLEMSEKGMSRIHCVTLGRADRPGFMGLAP